MIPWGWIAGGVAALVTANYARNKLNSRPRVGDVATVPFNQLIPQAGQLPPAGLNLPVTITAVTSLSTATGTLKVAGISGNVGTVPVKFSRVDIVSMTRNGVAVPNPAG